MTNTVEQEAREMGWVPQEDYKGDPDRWVDAATYAERGHTVLPILRQANQKLHQTTIQQSKQLAEMQETLKASQEAIQELQAFNTEETKRKIAEAKKQVLIELKAAKEAGDVAQEVELTDALTDIKVAEKEAAARKEPVQTSKNSAATDVGKSDPDLAAFLEANPWYGNDARKTAKANGIVYMLRSDPDNDDLIGAAFYKKVTEQMNNTIRQPSKVEGSTAPTAALSAAGKTYKDLPADAKAACNDPKRIARLVGSGRAFKDVAAWQAHYAQIYFKGDE